MPRNLRPESMTLGDKRPVDITDDEIRTWVANRVAETQDLDFKATFNHHDPKAPPKMLRHVASFANGGGGYMILGVREDGHSRALKLQGVQDAEAIAKSIHALCLTHLDPRVKGLEVHRRVVDTHELILVRVPRSARVPHMMKYDDATEFWTRHGDRRVQMTREEIREAFQDNPPRTVASGSPRPCKRGRRPTVLNGGFEQGLRGWGTGVFEGVPRSRRSVYVARVMRFGGALAHWYIDTREAHRGRHSLRVEHESPYTPHVFSSLSQRIVVRSWTRYEATFWAKVERRGMGAFSLRVIRPGESWDQFRVKIDNPTEWRQYWVRFDSGKHTALDVRFAAEGPIRAWIDSVSVRRLGAEPYASQKRRFLA